MECAQNNGLSLWHGNLRQLPGLETLCLSRSRFHGPMSQQERPRLVGQGRFGSAYLGSFNREWIQAQKHQIPPTLLKWLLRPLVVKRVDVQEQGEVRSQKELEVFASLMHASKDSPAPPVVVALGYFYSSQERRLHIVLDFCPAGDLARLVKKASWTDTQVKSLLRQMVRAIALCHQGRIVHRDIKAENFLLDSQGRTVLTDFGLADSSDDHASLMRTVGTLMYMSPECRSPSRASSYACDVYGVGCVGYLALTKTVPFVDRDEYVALVRAIGTAPPAARPLVRSRVGGLLRLRCRQSFAVLEVAAMQIPRFKQAEPVLQNIILQLCHPVGSERMSVDTALRLLEQDGASDCFADKDLINWGLWERIVDHRQQCKKLEQELDGNTGGMGDGGAPAGAPRRTVSDAVGGGSRTLGLQRKPSRHSGMGHDAVGQSSAVLDGAGGGGQLHEHGGAHETTRWNFFESAAAGASQMGPPKRTLSRMGATPISAMNIFHYAQVEADRARDGDGSETEWETDTEEEAVEQPKVRRTRSDAIGAGNAKKPMAAVDAAAGGEKKKRRRKKKSGEIPKGAGPGGRVIKVVGTQMPGPCGACQEGGGCTIM